MRRNWQRWAAMVLIILAGFLPQPVAVSAAQQTLYVQPPRANFRESPAIEPDNHLGVLPGGTSLKAFEPDGDWYPVHLQDGRTGWMHRSVLGPQPPLAPAAVQLSRLPVVRIGIVQDGKVLEADVAPIFKQEIRELLRGEYNVRFPEASQLQGDWTVPSVQAAMDRLLASPRVDMILALGALASHEAGQRRKLSEPVFAPFVINANLQNMPLREGASGCAISIM